MHHAKLFHSDLFDPVYKQGDAAAALARRLDRRVQETQEKLEAERRRGGLQADGSSPADVVEAEFDVVGAG